MMKLLTPGPLTTTASVREEMMEDRCTWDDDYKFITQKIRQQLLDLAKLDEETYTTVLMQGSGSFTVESVLTSTVKDTDKVLFITNGAYGERMVQMANAIGLRHLVYAAKYAEQPDVEKVRLYLEADPSITHIAMVHCETTTGMLNPIEAVGQLADQYQKTFIVDAMSSFGGLPIDIEKCVIDYLISSANKCIQGVPGFGFVIAKRTALQQCESIARSIALDLYDQWKIMDVDGKWRFTSPTHVVAAFSQAIDELVEEGGIVARYERYTRHNRMIREAFEALGFKAYIEEEAQSPIITTYLFPHDQFEFYHFYEAMKAEEFILYPGKLTDVDTFRVGNIGDLTDEDIMKLCQAVKTYMEVVSV